MPSSQIPSLITSEDQTAVLSMTEPPSAPAATDSEEPGMKRQPPNDQALERYVPPPRSPSSLRRIRIKNRRRRYLERHPSYFEGETDGQVNKKIAGEQRNMGAVGMETVDPLLYDRLVRRFQTAEERTAARRNKGFAATLSADLSRAEARLAAVSPNKSHGSSVNGQVVSDNENIQNGTTTDIADVSVDTGMKPFLIEPDSPTTREEGLEQWRSILTHRFVAGLDSDFDYTTVDNEDGKSSSWIGEDEDDDKERQEKWFEEDETDEEYDDENENGDDETIDRTNADQSKGGRKKAILTGETGIQDF